MEQAVIYGQNVVEVENRGKPQDKHGNADYAQLDSYHFAESVEAGQMILVISFFDIFSGLCLQLHGCKGILLVDQACQDVRDCPQTTQPRPIGSRAIIK